MKRGFSLLLVIATINVVFTSCENQDKGTPPDLPPFESMAIDFDTFSGDQKSSTEGTQVNFGWAAANIFIFNSVLSVTLAVPVAAFAASFQNEPVYLGESTWQWTYTVDGWFGKHTARLTGEIRTNDIKWEMFVARTGINPYEEFLWFEGTSALDGNGGQWVLHHSHVFQEPMLQIDWQRSGEEIGEITYTLVRELNDARDPSPDKGSYIQAGKTDAELDAYYTIFLAPEDRNVFIEWSLTSYNGRVKDEKRFSDNDWHCWDEGGFDIDCPQ